MNLIDEFENECRFTPQRREPSEYANVLVHNGYFDGGKWWYWMLEGEELFCLVTRLPNGDIKHFTPVRLTNTKVFVGREIPAQDCTIL